MKRYKPAATGFNKSLRVESRAERLTGDAGAVVLREILERSGIVEWVILQLRVIPSDLRGMRK
ncbi:hypothetical protein AB9K41_31255 [Cribrihabitans sp. XS_ASV171]